MPSTPILIVAKDAVIGELLGTLVELTGHAPLFPKPGERPAQAISRTNPRLVLLDCDHDAACRNELFAEVDATGAALLIFGLGLDQSEIQRAAKARRVDSFALPIGYRRFLDVISAKLVA